MMFESNLTEDPDLKTQILNHLPIALLAIGVLALFVALHVAITGVLIVAVGHLVIGLGLLAARRFRSGHSKDGEVRV